MNNKGKMSFVGSVFFFLLLVVSARADKVPDFTWSEVGEADWSISDDSITGGSAAVMLFEKFTIDDRKAQDSKCYRTIYRRIRIFNEAGRSWAEVEAPFISLDQSIEDVRGRTILPDGTVIELPPEQVFEKTAFKTKSDEFVQSTFSLPGVTDDCIIEYMIRYRVANFGTEWIIQKDIPLLKAECRWFMAEIKIPAWAADLIAEFMASNYIWLNSLTSQKVTKLPSPEATTELLFETADVPALKTEPHGLPVGSLRSKVICYYGSNSSHKSYWEDQSANVARTASSFAEKQKRLKKIVKSFGDLQSKEEKIQTAFEWVRDSITNISYINLYEYKDGKKKKKKKTKQNKSVDDVIKRRYGVRLDIDLLFWAMLKELGIDAKIVHARARLSDLFVPEVKYWQFDRTLVAIPGELYDYRFISPGHPRSTIDHVPWYCEGIEVLVADADSHISVVPFSRPELSTVKHSFTLNIAESLEMEGSITSETTGHVSRSLRMIVLDEPEDEMADLLQDELSDEICNAELDSLKFRHLEDIDQPLVMDARLQYSDLTDMGGRILLKPFDFLTCGENPFHVVERRGPILFPYAFEREEIASFKLPAGWVIEALPSDTSFTNLAGQCAVSFSHSEGTLTVRRSCKLTSPFWYPDQYSLIRNFYQSQEDQANSIVVLARKEK